MVEELPFHQWQGSPLICGILFPLCLPEGLIKQINADSTIPSDVRFAENVEHLREIN